MKKVFILKQFLIIVLITSIWVNASEVFRYFIIVRPEMHNYLSMVPHVADMNWSIFLIWGVWDTLLTALYVFIFWLCMQVYGNNRQAILISGLVSWCFFFVLFWVGMANMNLSSWSFIAIVLPLALLETLIASLIASLAYQKIYHKNE